MILMIDNYDSFTYNLVQYFGILGEEIKVFRNNKISIKEIEKLNPEMIVISPGPGTPNDAGISLELIDFFKEKIPILGICLGHQCIAQCFGGEIVKAERIMHGKISLTYHDKKGVFGNIESPLKTTRYHSLIINKSSTPDCFEICAWTEENEIMGIRHKKFNITGLQFHPESILTENGIDLLENFLKLIREN